MQMLLSFNATEYCNKRNFISNIKFKLFHFLGHLIYSAGIVTVYFLNDIKKNLIKSETIYTSKN